MTDGRYDTPLDAARMAAEQATQRARICDRLETMWQGLQTDIEAQRMGSERGVDPRLQQLQLQVLKLDAQLWRMMGAPLPEPPTPRDPGEERADALDVVLAGLDAVAADLARNSGGPPGSSGAPPEGARPAPDTSWIETTETT